MKKLSLAIVAAATVAASPAMAATTIKNTGTANANAWSVSGNPAAAATVVSDAQVNANFWDANTTTSQWVSTGSSTLAPNGQYTYSTNFEGNAGQTVFFDYWADDTAISMTLDGVTTNLSGADWTRSTRSSFTLMSANNNVHTLAFTVTNTGSPTASNPTGFRFQVAAVPEPATWGMMVLGFGAVGFAARRRSKVSGRVVAA